MAFGFVPVDRDQQFLLPPDMREWLPVDHEVWFVIDLVERLDLSALVATYRLGAQGRRPVSPAMLLTLVVWSYSQGVFSSRRIERACHEDVAFRVICGNKPPDHTTIARFRQRHEKVAESLFAQVLAMCGRAGLVSLGLVALDGTKMSANAALGANRDVERLRAKVAELFKAAEALDAVEDAEFGESTGLGLPEDLVDPARRAERLAEVLAEVEAEDGERQRVNTTDRESRVMHTADGGCVQGYNAQVVCGANQVVLAAAVTNEVNDYHQLVPMLDALAAALTAAGIDQSLGTVLADAGYFSTANMAELDTRDVDALVATTKRHELPEDGSGHNPDVEAAERVAYEADQARITAEVDAEKQRRAKVLERIDGDGLDVREYLEELGMCQSDAYVNLRRWREDGAEAIRVARPKGRVEKPAGRTKAQIARDEMNQRFADPENRELYKQRSHMVETYFGNTKANRGIRRFVRRGLTAVNAEWQLIATGHNINRLRTATT